MKIEINDGFFKITKDDGEVFCKGKGSDGVIKALDLEQPFPIDDEFKQQEQEYIKRLEKTLKTKFKLETKVWLKYDSLQVIIAVEKPLPSVWLEKVDKQATLLIKKYSKLNDFYHAYNDLQPYPIVVKPTKSSQNPFIFNKDKGVINYD